MAVAVGVGLGLALAVGVGVAAKSPARNASTSCEREAGSKSFVGYLFFLEDATMVDVVNVRPSPRPVLHVESVCEWGRRVGEEGRVFARKMIGAREKTYFEEIKRSIVLLRWMFPSGIRDVGWNLESEGWMGLGVR